MSESNATDTDDSRIDTRITTDADADIRVFNTTTDTEINRYATVDAAADAIETLVDNFGSTVTRDDYEIQVVPSVTAPPADEYETNYERVSAEYDDVMFALTDEKGEVADTPADDHETNAERLAADDGVKFAITHEETPTWREAARAALTGLAIGAAIGAAYEAYSRVTSDEEESR